MVDSDQVLLLERLAEGLDDAIFTADADLMKSYLHDQAPFCPAGPASVLVRARSTADVRHVLHVANEMRVPLVPQGARTGLSGGANSIEGCILLSLEKMNRILEINPVEQIAVVEPGVLNGVLSRAVAEVGLFYPPDPSSFETSTIGGNVSTNAGGLCCVKYGVTSRYVRALKVVLPGGEVLETGRRTAKGVAGYDLTQLFCGSEGTLGVITEVTVSLRPAADASLTALATFGSVADAVRAVADVMAGKHGPSLMEFMDAASIQAVNRYRNIGLPDDAAAILLVQSDRGELAARDLAEYAEVFRRHGANDVVEAEDAQESESLLEARRLVFPATEALGTFLVEDVCVPRGRMGDLIESVADISRAHGLLITCVGHAGDGNMHPQVTFDPRSSQQTEAAFTAFGEIMQVALSLGGTITGEHGVGLLKARWLGEEVGGLGATIQARIKEVFDPHGILNPGKVLMR